MAMSEIANPGRERILQRITKSLAEIKVAPPHNIMPTGTSAFAIIPDLLERFVAECKGNLTECVLAHGDTAQKLCVLLTQIPPGEIFAEDTPEIRALLTGIDRDVRWSSDGPPRECSQATITGVHLLIAQTGSLLVSSSLGGRGASVVAPVHIAIAHERQLVTDVEAALVWAEEQKLATTNSFVGVITGCSRTGDIEKLLVIGAHGPKRLVVIVDRDCCSVL
jgi:L-lactate dehydrogenase complex protein LldG